MNSLHPALARIFNILVPIFVVLAILIGAIRILVTPAFVRFEYATPNFPEDRYGFTEADRLKWAPYAVNYLVNSADPSYLGDLTFEDGSPLYNERELSHMLDVKNLTQAALKVWYGVLVVLLGLGIWAWRGDWLVEYQRMLGSGGKATVLFILALLVGVGLGFDAMFTGFHRIFFTGDTWLFNYSDTLIRLFPIRFWRDVFIALGVFSLVGGSALWLAFGRRKV
ncbi:MAG: TIGR01906 family membrane protein [Anaerolineales bacterium]|nr:TIGR01906 family membrane protein [Anaerolineales bacterium]